MSYYEYRDAEMYYEEVGDGTPFLLIHGWAIDHKFLMASLEPVFEECPKHYRRIYVDIPGMGRSKPGFVKNGDGIIEVLQAFINDRIPEEQIYVGGNSFGSEVTRALCAKIPDRVLGMLLMAPSTGLNGRKPVNGGVYYRDEEFLSTLSDAEAAGYSSMCANLTSEGYERYKREVLDSVRINENNEFLKKTLKGKFSFDINSCFRKKKYDRPVLILTGKYDTAVGYEDQFEWMSLYRGASYACMDGAGHNLSVDRPEFFRAIILGWLKSL